MRRGAKSLLEAPAVASMSATARGKQYELAAAKALQARLAASGLSELRVVGAAGDRGVDLVATWNGLDVLVQCKATAHKISSKLWRELGGVAAVSSSSATQGAPVLVALVSPTAMTAAALAEFNASSAAFMHCVLPIRGPIARPPAGTTSRAPVASLRSVVLNLAAEDILHAHGIKRAALFHM